MFCSLSCFIVEKQRAQRESEGRRAGERVSGRAGKGHSLHRTAVPVGCVGGGGSRWVGLGKWDVRRDKVKNQIFKVRNKTPGNKARVPRSEIRD